MQTALIEDGQRKDAVPSTAQMETGIDSTQDPSYGDAYQGIEFLDDAIRMEDQILETPDQVSVSNQYGE